MAKDNGERHDAALRAETVIDAPPPATPSDEALTAKHWLEHAGTRGPAIRSGSAATGVRMVSGQANYVRTKFSQFIHNVALQFLPWSGAALYPSGEALD